MSSDGSTGVELLFRGVPARLRYSVEEKRALKEFARTLSVRVAGGRGFTCLLTNDAALRDLNLRFLGHDYATDVLSFPSHSTGLHLGELAISLERAATQAREFGHSMAEEIHTLTLHGLLHLMGMDHENDRGEMASAEGKWRVELGLPSTLIARGSAEVSHR
jgi:probable rRNA maturation factor